MKGKNRQNLNLTRRKRGKELNNRAICSLGVIVNSLMTIIVVECNRVTWLAFSLLQLNYWHFVLLWEITRVRKQRIHGHKFNYTDVLTVP